MRSPLDGCVKDRDVTIERGVDRGVRVLQLPAVGVCRCWVGIEQRIARVDGPDQQLRANCGEQLLRIHVAAVDRGSVPLHLRHSARELETGDDPQPDREAKPKE